MKKTLHKKIYLQMILCLMLMAPELLQAQSNDNKVIKQKIREIISRRIDLTPHSLENEPDREMILSELRQRALKDDDMAGTVLLSLGDPEYTKFAFEWMHSEEPRKRYIITGAFVDSINPDLLVPLIKDLDYPDSTQSLLYTDELPAPTTSEIAASSISHMFSRGKIFPPEIRAWAYRYGTTKDRIKAFIRLNQEAIRRKDFQALKIPPEPAPVRKALKPQATPTPAHP